MVDRGKGNTGRGAGGLGSRGVLREIDERLAEVDGELAGYRELVAERNRLAAARALLTGTKAPAGLSVSGRRLTGDEIAAFLAEHPGSKAGEIARAFEVPLTNVSQHLYRGKTGRFEARGDGWYLRETGT
jgi:DNA-binding transcriptional ArsR family regulator